MTLKDKYEWCCEEYRRLLCKLWDVRPEESWWVSERIGTQLCIADAPWGLGMEEVRYVVENSITVDLFMEWWNFVECEIHDGKCPPRINFNSWFIHGARPEDLE